MNINYERSLVIKSNNVSLYEVKQLRITKLPKEWFPFMKKIFQLLNYS